METVRTLKDLQLRLRTRYKENRNIKLLFYRDHPLPLEKCYLHLALIDQDEFKKSKNATDEVQKVNRDYILRDYERIKTFTDTLNVGEILTRCSAPQRRIFIEGPAGSGKTTLCRYIAYQWALDKESKEPWAKEFDWLFWVPLRKLSSNINVQGDLTEFVIRECFGWDIMDLTEPEKNEIKQLLRSNSSRILWLLDGYDELNLESSYAKNLWHSLKTRSHAVFMTSRPGHNNIANSSENNFSYNLQLAVLGLSDEQITEYSHAFFQHILGTTKLQTVDELIDHLKKNLNLWSIAHTPIALEMLCSLWAINLHPNQSKKFKLKSDTTLTDLYQEILNQLLLRYYSKPDPNKPGNVVLIKKACQVYLDFMERLAYEGMASGEILLTKEHINSSIKLVQIQEDSATFYKRLQDLGLINLYQEGPEIVQAEFAHLTFQEFFAARYIKKQLKVFVESEFKEKENFLPLINYIQQKKHDSFNEVMWWFVAGLLAKSQIKELTLDWNKKDNLDELTWTAPKHTRDLQALQLFFDLLLSEPRPQVEFNEICLLVRCLDEAKLANIMQKEAIIAHFKNWLQFYVVNSNLLQNTSFHKITNTINYCSQLAKENTLLQLGITWLNPNMFISIWYTVRDFHTIWRSLIKANKYSHEFEQAIINLSLNNKVLHLNFIKILSDMGLKFNILLPIKDQFINSLNSNKPIEREWTIKLIDKFGPEAIKLFKEKLISLFKDQSEDVRQNAITAIIQIDTDKVIIKRELVALLKSEDNLDREKIIVTLAKLDVSILELVKEEYRISLTERFKLYEVAIQTITKLGRPALALFKNDLIDFFKDVNNNIIFRIETTFILFQLELFEIEELKCHFIKLFTLEEPNNLKSFINAITECNNIKIIALFKEELVKSLDSQHHQIRKAAVIALAKIGSELLPTLKNKFIELLDDSNYRVRREVVIAIANAGKDSIALFKTKLIERLSDNDSYVRIEILKIIITFDPHTITQYESELIKSFSMYQSDPDTCSLIIKALMKIDTSTISKIVVSMLDEYKNEEEAIVAFNAITMLAPNAIEEYRDKFVALLAKNNSFIQSNVLRAIALQPPAIIKLYEQQLLDLFEKQKLLPVKKSVLINAIVKLDSDIITLKAKLTDWLNRKDLQANAIILINELGPQTIKIMKNDLINLTKNPVYYTKLMAVSILTQIEEGILFLCNHLQLKEFIRIPPSLTLSGNVKDFPALCGKLLPSILHDNVNHTLSENYWTVALVRKKEGQHAFLVLEGIDEGKVYFAKRIDLVIPNANKNSFFINPNFAEIRIQKLSRSEDYIHLRQLSENCICQVYSISANLGNQLLGNSEADQEKKIYYNYSGDGSFYSFYLPNNEKHNCISWCLKQLQLVGIPIKRKWYDAIAVIPESYLSDEPKVESRRGCLLS